MSSGGARTRSGPPPDPNALRRERDAGEWVDLPGEGRDDAPPEWPLTDFSPRERELWLRLWSMPQALMWERYGQELEVALYARQVERFEQPRSSVILGTLVRQMADSLGLTTPGLRANRWRIAREDSGLQRGTAPVVPLRASARDRLKALRGAADAG
jgi:hypothetical protein